MLCVQSPLWLTGLKAQTNFLHESFVGCIDVQMFLYFQPVRASVCT